VAVRWSSNVNAPPQRAEALFLQQLPARLYDSRVQTARRAVPPPAHGLHLQLEPTG